MRPTPVAAESRSASEPHSALQGESRIYLDHHATTPCDPRVFRAMARYFVEDFGNAASRTHAFGWDAAAAVERAREQVAESIGARAREVIFTSGATEANNLALIGSLRAAARMAPRTQPLRVLTTRIEHPAVLDPCAALRREGVEVIELGVSRAGHVDPDELERELARGANLVSIMHANNEIGVVQDLAGLAARCRAAGALVHTDAAQSVGKVPFDVREIDVDLASISGHKLYAPKGIGALYVRQRRPPVPLEPLLHGGGHERGLRSGTLPVPLCVGLGEACALARAERDQESTRLLALRTFLEERLSKLPDVTINGDRVRRLPGNLHVSFGGIDAEALLLALSDVALSTGSACSSAKREPSHVLRALGLPKARALGSVRIGLGRTTTRDDVERASERIVAEVERLRALRPPAR